LKASGPSFSETDRLYSILANQPGTIYLKARDTAIEQELIFERVSQELGIRTSSICVAYPRQNPTDSPIENIFGDADHVIVKQRQIFTQDPSSRLRAYIDHNPDWQDGRFLLEIQLSASSDIEADRQKMAQVIEALGLTDRPITSDSYALMAVKDIMPGETELLEVLSQLPSGIVREIMAAPLYSAGQPTRLVERGAFADTAYLITRGTAQVVDHNVTLHSGQLVGEFGFLEGGVRTSTVVVEPGFEARVLSPGLVAKILLRPAFATKYMAWKLAQAQAERLPS